MSQARLLIVLALLAIAATPSALLSAQTAAQTPPAPVTLSTGWEYRWGDSPLNATGSPAWAWDTATTDGWRRLDRLSNPEGREGQSFVWFRVRLPKTEWPNAVFHVPSALLACEVYLDGVRLVQIGSLRADRRNRYLTMTGHTIPLPARYAGGTLAIRLYSDAPGYIGLGQPPVIGSPEEVAKAVVVANLDHTVLGLFLTLIGLFSLLLYLSRRGWTRLEYLSFGAFATCVGVGSITASVIVRWLIAPALAYYLVFLSFPLFPVGLFAFLAQVLGEGPFRILRRMWQFHLGLVVVGVLLDILDLQPLPELQTYLLPILALDVIVVLVLANRGLPRDATELKVLNFGAAVLALTGLHDIVCAWWFPGQRPLFHWGTAGFVLLLGYLLERRFWESHLRLEEQTRQLERANSDLQGEIAVRKKAEQTLLSAHAVVEQLKYKLEVENVYLQEEIKLEHNFESIITRNDAFRGVLRKVEQVASTDATVLILGETGTGKELVARAVHNLSTRRQRPLVKVNCAALPVNLIESELFGHEKGAFTGALTRQLGRFELADGGTIFLDEAGDLPLELQAKLLRVLQEGEFERLGNPKTVRVDVRVIAATNRDLAQAIAQGSFRRDLFYRLNVFPIELPPLRERREDIPLLVEHFVRHFSTRSGKPLRAISQAAMRALLAYGWPGNVRELENVVERAVVISRGPELGAGDWLPTPEAAVPSGPLAALAAVEEEHIRRVLQATGWRVSGERGAADILGLKRTTLEARMHRLGITRPPEA